MNVKTYDEMRERPPWIIVSCAAARASDSANTAPHFSGDVDHGLHAVPREHKLAYGKLFGSTSWEPPSWA